MLLQNPQNRFKEIYPIYKEAFPEIERRTKEGQKAVFNNAYYRVRVVEEEGKIVAFLGYWELPSCVFFEHLATAESCRGKGYGKNLVEECLREIQKPVFLEIEPISKENPITKRRANFYERLGFFLNTFYYEQMPLKEGDKKTPLQIMSDRAPISEKEFQPYKKEIYQIVYHISDSENTSFV